MQAYTNGNLTQMEVAKKFRVKMVLVSNLVMEAKKNPEKHRKLKQKESELKHANQVVE